MKTINTRKFLSSIFIAVYLMVYASPMAFCLVNAPVAAKVGVSKAAQSVLRAPENSVLKLEGDISITKGNPKISLSLRDSDVKQVLRMFADKAGLNIVFHNSVDGKVTLDLVNVPLNDAFKLVMQIADLTYYVDHNTMVVASSATAATLNLSKQEMVSIPVKYVDAAVLADFLNKNIFSINKPGLSNSQIAITNPVTNEVLIFGTENDVKMARKIISKFDVKTKNTTYVVNHTTPKEMANLLCTVLFPPAAVGGGSAGGAQAAPAAGSAPAAPAQQAPPSPPSGSPTGGAADNSTSALTLGAGVIACQYNNKVSAGTLSSFSANSMMISYFTQHGTIAVSGGSDQQLELIKDFIIENDKKQPQAYLEISIIELNESGMRQFDNTWQFLSENFSIGFDGGVKTNPLYPNFLRGDEYVSALGKVTKQVDPVTGAVTYTQAPDTIIKKYGSVPTLTYTINYLIENQKGRVLSNPRIMITNGETSTIDLTSDYVKSVKSQVLAGSVAGGTQKTYEIASDDGIKVTMIPFISPDGYVTLNIKPEYATIKERITTPSSAGGAERDIVATLLQRRNLDLKNVRIKDGETLVIGGMIREDEQKTVAKFPGLADIPGIGMMFRNTDTSKTKSELIIMITPKIIKDSEDFAQEPDVTL